jgi:hypothetical protein
VAARAEPRVAEHVHARRARALPNYLARGFVPYREERYPLP